MHRPPHLLPHPKSSLHPLLHQQSGTPTPHSPHTSQHSGRSHLMWQRQVWRRAKASSPEFPCWQRSPTPGSPIEVQERRAGPGSSSGRRSLQSQRGSPHAPHLQGFTCPGCPPDMPEHAAASRLRLSALCFLLQILNILLFAVFVRYSPESSPGQCPPQLNCSRRNQDSAFQEPREYPPHPCMQRSPSAEGDGVGCHRAQFRLQTGSRVKHKREHQAAVGASQRV